MDKVRYKWKDVSGVERWLIDTNEHNKVVAIIEKSEEANTNWFGVYGPFKKKGHGQFLDAEDAQEFAEENFAQGEKEERVEWES